ncbi:uncharacterized protein G2W53_026718 [Senna tora]|uniref:Uncharacterized protein n=1 Tax=Senna tora TaxID=362788 RepID=A0A834TFI9_9FABA|nr:uncharacterized protein G2W53_026718 [Senna tora]
MEYLAAVNGATLAAARCLMLVQASII